VQYQIEKLPDYTRVRVRIAGDVMLDRYWAGRTERISFEAPVPIVDVQHIDERPGGAGNVAVNLAALGVSVDLYGMVGCDEEAECLQQLLQAVKINHHLLHSASISTTTKLRIISRQQQLVRLDFEDNQVNIDCTVLQQQCFQQLDNINVLILSDYGKGVLHDPQPWIEAAKQYNVKVVVDPKKKAFDCYRGATIVTPNFNEFQAVVGECFDETSLVERGMLLLKRYDIQALLITRGAQGMTLLQKQTAPLHLPSQAQQAYDVTGAGDTVIALLAAGIAAGQSLADATYVANVAAGIAVSKLGTATVQMGELQEAIEQSAEYHNIINHHQQLLSMVVEKKRLGKRIVMLVGDFDILTLEHVEVLKAAKRRGNYLLVAVFDAATVLQQTGQEPIHSIFARQAALAGLASVDWVFSVSLTELTDSLYNIIPDVLLLSSERKNALPAELLHYLSGDSKTIVQYLTMNEMPEKAKILQAICD